MNEGTEDVSDNKLEKMASILVILLVDYIYFY
jgi:hypothetical protein